MRVVIDTNIWISYLIGGLLQGLDEKILSNEVKVVVSEELLKELIEVSKRPKFNKIFTVKRMKELLSLLDNYAIVVYPSEKVNICRDVKDNFLLDVGLEGKVDYLITGDEDLLALNPFRKIKIVRPKEFEEILKK